MEQEPDRATRDRAGHADGRPGAGREPPCRRSIRCASAGVVALSSELPVPVSGCLDRGAERDFGSSAGPDPVPAAHPMFSWATRRRCSGRDRLRCRRCGHASWRSTWVSPAEPQSPGMADQRGITWRLSCLQARLDTLRAIRRTRLLAETCRRIAEETKALRSEEHDPRPARPRRARPWLVGVGLLAEMPQRQRRTTSASATRRRAHSFRSRTPWCRSRSPSARCSQLRSIRLSGTTVVRSSSRTCST